ncbi:type II secretion system protein GspC [Salinivibrio sp. HTSP]|uniref:type II secretion system protein GspC n=1 Tax=Salinivibrio sp. HTSP TaxID=2115977 RepID=UPI000E31E8BD|nr:type II secretion system protein GspC [Salinivibrio sp. HTSP]
MTQIGLKGMISQAGRQHNRFSLSPQTLRRAAPWLNIGLVCVLAWLAGRLVWAFYQPAPPTQSPVVHEASTSQSPGNRLSLASVINAQLFGRYQASKAQRRQAVSEVPETRLQLTLVGVVASDQPSRALAVIANRGQQATYGVGEQVNGTQVSIDQVLSDRVILRQGTRREALLMPGVEADSTPQTVFSPSKGEVAPPKPTPHEGASTDWPVNLAQQLNQNPQRLFDYVQLAQVGDAKALKGFRLTPGKNPVLFEQSGLQPGDIAIAINGLKLSRSVALPDILSRIQQQGTLDLVVERQGQQHDISIQL